MKDQEMSGRTEKKPPGDADPGSEDDFARRLRSTMEGYAPPVADELREEMWREIRARRRRGPEKVAPGAPSARAEPAATLTLDTRRWRTGAVLRGLAAAAVVVLAFGLGWISGRSTPVQGPGGERSASAAGADAAESNAWTYMPQATEHLVEAEMLLVLFSSDSADADPEGVRKWARSLLGTTRLLLDSDAGRDPTLAEPLRDLELVLVQIANLGDGGPSSERGFIHESLRERQVLEKIRAASEAGLDQEAAD